MKATVTVAVTVLVLSGVVQLFAANGQTAVQKGRAPSVDQKKAEILQHIEERIANSKLEISCVQSAQSHDALKACRDRFRPQPMEDHRSRN